MKICKKIS